MRRHHQGHGKKAGETASQASVFWLNRASGGNAGRVVSDIRRDRRDWCYRKLVKTS